MPGLEGRKDYTRPSGYLGFKAALEGLSLAALGSEFTFEEGNLRTAREAAQTAIQVLDALVTGKDRAKPWEFHLPTTMKLHQNGSIDTIEFSSHTVWSGGSISQKAEMRIGSHYISIEGYKGFRCNITLPTRGPGEMEYDAGALSLVAQAWAYAMQQYPNPDADPPEG